MSFKGTSKHSVVGLVSVLACLAIACVAQEEEEADSDGAALSDSTCRPRASKAQEASAKKCKAENPLLDWTTCMAPADKAWSDYMTAVEEARRPVESRIDTLTGKCRSAVDGMSDDTILDKQAPRNLNTIERERWKSDLRRMGGLRAKQKLQCDVDAKRELEAALGADSAYVTLLDMKIDKQLAWSVEVVACATKSALAYAKNASCTGELAYQSEYHTCRKSCSALSEVACSPKSYREGEVPCGKLVNEEGFSWRAGATCEETSRCVRTPVCRQYDILKEAADEVNAVGTCNGNGVSVVVIEKDSRGRATGATIQCRTSDTPAHD